MYLQHFGLAALPFSLAPDPEFYFGDAGHQNALNVLLIALQGGEGFVKVTGEVGTGKTLLCRMLLKAVGDDVVTAYLPNPCLTPDALYKAFADELGIRFPSGLGQHRLLKKINQSLLRHAERGCSVVLVLDEAQSIPREALEALRLLTNLETEKRKLLQIVLFGQPELDDCLHDPSIRQLRQRITFSYRLRSLDLKELHHYVGHRLEVAGYRGTPVFGRRALRRLYHATAGTPRLVNVLCHKALLSAYGTGDRLVRPGHMARAVADTESVATRRRVGRYPGYGLFRALASMLGAGVGVYFWNSSP